MFVLKRNKSKSWCDVVETVVAAQYVGQNRNRMNSLESEGYFVKYASYD